MGKSKKDNYLTTLRIDQEKFDNYYKKFLSEKSE